MRSMWVMPSSLRCTVVMGTKTASSWSEPQAVAPFSVSTPITVQARPLMTMDSSSGLRSPNSSRATVCPSTHTWLAARTWRRLMNSPSASGQLRTVM
jgi:hypothetical protein